MTNGLGYIASPCRMVAEMRQPHALFRWASSARCCCSLSLVQFPVVACVEPWVRLSFSLSLLLLSLALLLLVGPAAYQPSACCLGLHDLCCSCIVRLIKENS
ncbi:hypothetical protein VPH35_091375 [Triticum aestivum]